MISIFDILWKIAAIKWNYYGFVLWGMNHIQNTVDSLWMELEKNCWISHVLFFFYIQTCSVKTALLPVYEANMQFLIGPGRHWTYWYFLDLLHPNKVRLDVSKKVLYILVRQRASKLPAVKVFVASKSSNLHSKMLISGTRKNFDSW